MTKLDAFEPTGTPIHPLDLFDLLSKPGLHDVLRIEDSPSTDEEADYIRNLHKVGTIVEVDGHRYFQTTSVEPKTARFI